MEEDLERANYMERFSDPLLILASLSPLSADWASQARAEPRYLLRGFFVLGLRVEQRLDPAELVGGASTSVDPGHQLRRK